MKHESYYMAPIYSINNNLFSDINFCGTTLGCGSISLVHPCDFLRSVLSEIGQKKNYSAQ